MNKGTKKKNLAKPQSNKEGLVNNKPIEEKEKKAKDNKIYTSFFVDNNLIFEQVIHEGYNKFAVWDETTKKVQYINSYKKDDKEYFPNYGEEIDKKFIYLPTKTEKYTSIEQLELDIKSFIGKWLDIPEEHLQYATWNIIKSWNYDRFRTVNYLRAIGDTGQGKSRYLRTLGFLHYKPIITSGATTSAPLFRIIEKWRGTMLIDEFDLRQSDESVEIIKIINLGFEKDNSIMRCETNNPKLINFFDPYCPKLIVSRKPFDDKATESRCFTITMEGTERKDIPLELNEEFFKEAQILRNKLLLWRFKNYFHIDLDKISEIDLGDLEPRIKQINQGFVALFWNDKAKLESFKRFLLKRQENLILDRKNSFSGIIVEAICNRVFLKNQENISPSDIIEEGCLKDKDGKLLSPNSIAKDLKELGLGDRKTKHVDGRAKNCILYDKEKLQKLAKRYGVEITNPDSDLEW
jgi:hypothetical protein